MLIEDWAIYWAFFGIVLFIGVVIVDVDYAVRLALRTVITILGVLELIAVIDVMLNFSDILAKLAGG